MRQTTNVMRASACVHFAVLLALSATACVEVREVRNSWDEFAKRTGAQRGGQGADETEQRRADPTGGRGWAIRMHTFEGPNRHHRASELIKRLKVEADLTQLWIEDAGRQAVVYLGRFPGPAVDEARIMVDDVRRIELHGEHPFAHAALVPLTGVDRAFADPYNLMQYPGYFSLQIGFYDGDFEGDHRDAAELMVRILRERGDEAYYFHGPHRSHVTVGLFTKDEAFVTIENPLAPGTLIDAWSPEIKTLQEKYPYNLGNGLTLIQKVEGKPAGGQKSSLIRVPG